MDLKVQIPKRYKKTLSMRFNPKYAEYNPLLAKWCINTRCPLCAVHRHNCLKCPFVNCFDWMDRIYGRKKQYWFIRGWSIAFYEWDKSKAIKSLNWFRDRAEKLIEWI